MLIGPYVICQWKSIKNALKIATNVWPLILDLLKPLEDELFALSIKIK